MPRENSFSDSEGRSLTPDMSEEEDVAGGVPPTSPIHSNAPGLPSPTANIVATEPHPPPQAPKPAPSVRSHGAPTHRSGPTLSPKDRFRASVRKVISLHRSTSILTRGGGWVGAEPGIDPRRESAFFNYGGIHQDCVIEVIDYSSVRSSFGKMTNKEFVGMMQDPKASEREPWVKVRWINIGGISWDVISAVAIKYDLHPLALEDVLHQRDQNRSKADYYHKHLFLRVLCHTLLSPDDEEDVSILSPNKHPARGSTLTDLPRSSSPIPFTEDDKEKSLQGINGVDVEPGELGDTEVDDPDRTLYGRSAGRRKSMSRMWRRNGGPLLPSHRRDLHSRSTRSTSGRQASKVEFSEPQSKVSRFAQVQDAVSQAKQQRVVQEITIDELKKGERVNVKVSPMFIFLLRGGTVISMHPTPNVEFTSPITARLRQRDTGLRMSADPSMLVQSLLDLIVDQALEVIDEYHDKIKKFERDILLKPQMKTVRNLHILSGDLILHKRTLEPIKTVIYGLRRYDLDRCAALIDSTATPGFEPPKVIGFMSHKSKIYLADVYDHMEYILTSLEMFAGIAENLIDYTFNMASYEMNEVMRRLTVATIIFLPLTLLTGYFGMNFDFMWSVHGRSDILFWEIAIPMMVVIIPLGTYPDIMKVVHHIKKKMLEKKVVKTLKQD